MCTVESPIHQNIKEKIVASTEQDTIHMFRSVPSRSSGGCGTLTISRTLKNTARVYRNSVSTEVVRLERRPGGAKFEDVRELVSGARGRKVYEDGDTEAGVWS